MKHIKSNECCSELKNYGKTLKMKLKDAPIRSTVQFNDNRAEVLKHGEMGTSVKILESKRDSIALGKTVLSNGTEISLLRGRI